MHALHRTGTGRHPDTRHVLDRLESAARTSPAAEHAGSRGRRGPGPLAPAGDAGGDGDTAAGARATARAAEE
ncbi:hypothetical protein [Streptomyces sp. x-80]|uniref:hypothetical protein n=1 Tax=Streptomyces sp. x-80 TaxID=2789282 RepID=UPI00397FE0CA